METMKAIKTRKSPNAFLPDALGKDVLTELAQAGAYAPIFGKLHFTVIDDAQLIGTIDTVAVEMMKHSGNEFAEKMANSKGYSAVRHAPAFIIISSEGGMNDMGFGMANASCAAENILLAATEKGIGSRFMMGPIMALGQDPIKGALDLPEGYEPLVMVALGKVDDAFEERTKDIDNITFA